ncbi:Acetyl esterase/lipase [Neorhodopirellula lusitana]|uniref:Acetyl esterase/lipase n=1 Tax=Neorhodopirellula lusitana TaxID=445327 RepID=A0ABY1Q5R0_9BACT|nr:Acetyl esterase/lipase [Neorhodopirellula lusitana]
MINRSRQMWLIATFICLFTVTGNAQSTDSPKASPQTESLKRATQAMGKLDKDGNGTFEKQENVRAFNRRQKLDTNKDDVLTIKELQRERKNYLATNGEQKLDVVYKRVGRRELQLDLYYPTSNAAGPYPVIIYTHGGGWAAGSKQGAANGSFAAVFSKLLDHGFAVASVDYRLYRKDGPIAMRDCVIDSKDAVRYLAKNANSLNLNPSQCFTMGDSAGGQIAQMLLLTSPESLAGDVVLSGTEYQMVAGVSWYGPCDFEKTDLFNHDDRADFRDRFGPRILLPDSDPADKIALYREMSPINYLAKNSPPLLMIQGDKDTTIPVKHAYYMKQKADTLAAPVEIKIVKNAGHNWRKVDADIEPTREEIVDLTVQFFVNHLTSTVQ